MHITAADVANSLGGAKKSGINWSCRCPTHDDQKSSLSVRDSAKGILVRCHAGCSQDEVVTELKRQNLWPHVAKKEETKMNVDGLLKQTTKKIVAEYDYVDEGGEILFTAIRYEPKDFRQRAPDGKWSIQGIRRVPYRLPAVIQAVRQGLPVYIVEGEKDVHAAESLGLVATCNPLGADKGHGNKWLPEFAEFFKGASVVIVPDQDEAGKVHADWVAENLKLAAKKISVLNVPHGKDLADWVHDGAELKDVIDFTTEYKIIKEDHKKTPDEQGPEELFESIKQFGADLRPISWLVDGYIEEETVCQIFGAPAGGKSFVTVSLACAVATGSDWYGSPTKKGPVFYVAGEGHNGLKRRFVAWFKHKNLSFDDAPLFKSKKPMQLLDGKEADELILHIEKLSRAVSQVPKLIVIDTLARSFLGGDENSAEDMGLFFERLSIMSRRFNNCTIIVVHHSGNSESQRARGSSAGFAAVESQYRVSKNEEGVIELKNTKMKDAEERENPTLFRFKGVEIGQWEGEPITSAVLEQEEDNLSVSVGKTSLGEPISAKDAVKAFMGEDTSYSVIASQLIVTEGTVRRAIIPKLQSMGLVAKKDPSNKQSGWISTPKAKEMLSHTGEFFLKNISNAPWKNDQNPKPKRVDIDG